jgi:uncharacterized protein (TIGR02597 family)
MTTMRSPCHRFVAAAYAASLLIGALATQASAQSAATDPIGLITMDIQGQPDGQGAAFSFRGLGLTRAVEYQGSAEQAAGKTLRDNEAAWQQNQFSPEGATTATATHYLEIVRRSGTSTPVPGEGTTYDIVATDAVNKTLTLAQDLASGVGPGALFKIRKHWTIGSVFGVTNPQGVQAGSLSDADQVLVHNGTGYDIYYYEPGNPLNPSGGWRNAADPSATNVAAAKILQEEGVIIKRRHTNSSEVTIVGAVKTGSSSIPVLPGTNIIANVFAAPMTLASSMLYTGNSNTGLAAGNLSTADQVLIHTGSGYDIYYYENGNFLNPAGGWRNAAKPAEVVDVSKVHIPVGSSLIVKRRQGTGFDWKIPQHPAQF